MSLVSHPCSMLFGTGVAGTNDRSLTISALVSNGYNLLTEAEAAGFVNTGITAAVSFTINSGIMVTNTSATLAAVTTGAFENRHSITLYNNGTIGGVAGDTSTVVGGNGSTGGVGLDVNCSITVVNSGVIGSGGGGGGGPGEGRQAYWDDFEDGGVLYCYVYPGSTCTGLSGSPGTLGAVGNNGAYCAGTSWTGGGAGIDCVDTVVGNGGATGTSIKSNGNTVDYSGSGTVLGPET